MSWFKKKVEEDYLVCKSCGGDNLECFECGKDISKQGMLICDNGEEEHFCNADCYKRHHPPRVVKSKIVLNSTHKKVERSCYHAIPDTVDTEELTD